MKSEANTHLTTAAYFFKNCKAEGIGNKTSKFLKQNDKQ